MWETYLAFTALLFILTVLPKIPSSYWIFPVADFAKIQVTVISLVVFAAGFIFIKNDLWWYSQSVLFAIIIFHAVTLVKYTHFYPLHKISHSGFTSSKLLKIISANVYQFNEDHTTFIDLIKKNQPDIVLTMESDKKWENALRVLEDDYAHTHKVTLENTYGMHFYSKLKVSTSTTHYFVADDIPSIEIHLKTDDGYEFVFFGIHPPPPSPTEEETSKERDGDLLSVAKRIKDIEKPVLVIGDFNNVAWSRSSVLFRKTSHLIDPRIGRGFFSTFHAKYRLLRFPIDLMFHSKTIFVEELKTLEKFGSDHLPVFCEFFIDHKNSEQEDKVEIADAEEKEEAEEIIEEGKKEDGDRDAVAEEY